MSAAGPGPASARLLETGFATGLNFLAAWRAWKLDPARPRMLHYVGTTAQPVEASALVAAAPSALQAMARQLAAQWYGLLPGFHRMVFEEGHVLLTLCVGDARSLLREQDFAADAVLLHETAAPAGTWDLHALKSVARLCRRGATLAAGPGHEELLSHLAGCGFASAVQDGTGWRTVYAPAWEPKG
ncbi:MAG: MnmC family methyltransferase, partial [Ramlibacter sp.]